MRINTGETFESWSRRVQQYEYGYALQRIAKGEPQPYDASKAPVVLICIQGIYPSWDW